MKADAKRCAERRERMMAQVPEVDVAVFSDAQALAYFTGFAPIRAGMSEFRHPLLFLERGGGALLVLPELFAGAFEAGEFEANGGRVVFYTDYGPEAPELPTSGRHALAAALAHLPGKVGALGVQASHLPFDVLEGLRDKYAPRMVDVEPAFRRVKAVKDPDEVALIRRAIKTLELAYREVVARMEPGMTEAELFGQVYAVLAKEVGRPLFFQGDVASGPRSHAMGGWATGRVLEAGDPFILDLWTTEGGYWADMCRTVIVGAKPTAGQQKVYDTLLRAQDAGQAMLKPGVRAADVFHRVAEVIRESGLPGLPHHAGHGIGVYSHEAPFFLPQSEDVLEAGMVVTLEPGTYPGGDVGGFRIENDFLITGQGAECLTDLPRLLP